MKGRELASGKVLYYYQAAGKQKPLGSNLVAAKEEWARLEAGGASAEKFPTVTALYRKAAFQNFSLSTRDHYGRALDNLDLAFKVFTLEQIEPKHVKQYMRRRTKKGAALFEKRVGAAFFSWAREEGHTKAANPFKGVTFSKAEKRSFGHMGRRKVYVTDAQYRAVWAAGDAVLQDAMDLAYRTGQRPGDILKARRQDIIDGVLWFVQQKTEAKVGVRIKGELQRVLERVVARERPVPSMYLICDRRGQRVSLSSLEYRFCKARGDATWQFRDIRAKTSTDMPDLKKAQLLLGHTKETTTTIYRRSADEIVDPQERSI
jgi:integrase